MTIKWNKDGDKFCSSSGGKLIIIVYYDSKSKWWKAEEIKYHKSGLTCTSFDSSGLFVISGSTDNRIAIHSCYKKIIDDKDNLTCCFDDSFFKVCFNI